jgi:SAM-dependent methyltransferase
MAISSDLQMTPPAQSPHNDNELTVSNDSTLRDNDSALGDNDDGTSTTSMNSDITKFLVENGRTYHAYKAGIYLLPNDEEEQNRLDLQHHLFIMTYGDKLFNSPDLGNKYHRVLDIGTGTGIWAIDFADEHPTAKVFGIDLSPIQPEFIPPNVEFQVDDLQQEWTFRDMCFDFIHARGMAGSFKDWQYVFREAFR